MLFNKTCFYGKILASQRGFYILQPFYYTPFWGTVIFACLLVCIYVFKTHGYSSETKYFIANTLSLNLEIWVLLRIHLFFLKYKSYTLGKKGKKPRRFWNIQTFKKQEYRKLMTIIENIVKQMDMISKIKIKYLNVVSKKYFSLKHF